MSVDIKGALSKPLFGVPAWVWGVVIAGGVVAYAYLTNGRDGDAPVTAPDAGPSYQDGGAADAGDISGTPTVTENVVTVTTNPAWVRVVTDRLVAGGFDPLQVGNALNKALAGLTLTPQEGAIWNEAVRRFKAPPEGNPPVSIDTVKAPTDPTPVTPVTPVTTAPTTHTSPPIHLSVFGGGKVEDFNAEVRRQAGFFVDWAVITAANPGIETNINWVLDINARTWKHNASYYVPPMTR